MTEARKALRCAVYTRKSTEHNLDLEFNSLHAQREACEAYIKSQLHEGWRLVPDRYDDGGISGGSLDRPDLQRLLADIAAGRVDVVVVYKVDRLTRSLTDFAKLVDLFDRHGVSFVSITQAFNTTNSMGRLTLNVLLSFAQFEREVSGERIRDKIAASKKRGMWMGGPVPMGYINRDKKLVIVPDEAERVRWIFNKYLQLGSIGLLQQEMDRLGIRTPVRTSPNGVQRGGLPYRKGNLAHLLRNCCYVGDVPHRGAAHRGEHEPIIDRATFEAVQAGLATNAVVRKAKAQASDFLLTGLIFDSAGNRMSPSHSRKKGVRYRYYVSQAVLQALKGSAGAVARVPAPDIEALIERFVRGRAGQAQTDLKTLVHSQIATITVREKAVELELRPSETADQASAGAGQRVVSLPWSRKAFSAEKGILIDPDHPAPADPKARNVVLEAIARSRAWVDELMAGGSLAEIAKREGKGERQVRLLMPLAFVPPTRLNKLINGAGQIPSVSALARGILPAWDRPRPA